MKRNYFYPELFRLVFVFFSLYLMGDAFYRWDGFSKYASFADFLPGVALAAILWSIVSIITSIIIWGLFRLSMWCFSLIGFNVRKEHLLLCSGMLVLLGALVWKAKTLILPYVQTTLLIKLAVFCTVFILTMLLTWRFRNNAERWVQVVHERVTPLVWLFGILVILSVPLVAYHTWLKQSGSVLPEEDFQGSFSEGDRPNVVLLTFDSLTSRNMSLYGYDKETTPFIGEWAKDAIVFTNAEAESNFTTSATASLMTGKRVWSHRTFHIEGTKPVNSHVESLPYLLKKYGYFNMAFVVNLHTSVYVLGMDDSFNLAPLASDFSEPASLVGWQFGLLDVLFYRNFGTKIRMYDWILKDDFILKKILLKISRDFSITTVPPEKVFNAFLDLMEEEPQRPFFAWIHVFPPHDPYLPPLSYIDPENLSSGFRTWKSQEQVKIESYKYLFQYTRYPEEMQPAVDIMRNYYDDFISYSDKQFEEFVNKFNAMGMDNTLFILSSDHGESFDHGYFTHGGPFLYEQVTHIPLIIKWPRESVGKVVNDRVEQIDIPATILDMVGIPVPAWMEGRSLVPLAMGENFPARPAFSMNFEENPSRKEIIEKGSVAVWDGDYKLVHYLEKGESLLFNLRKDPDEMDNIVDSEPDVAARLLGLIKDNLQKANDRILHNEP